MILYIIMFAAAICFAIFGLRYHTHMLQLSSYQFQGYFRHLKTDRKRVIYHICLMLLTLAFLTGYASVGAIRLIGLIACLVFYIGLFISYRPKQAKKKFVVTDRVKRLFITYAIISLIILLPPFINILRADP